MMLLKNFKLFEYPPSSGLQAEEDIQHKSNK